jgi:hypothetical protein
MTTDDATGRQKRAQAIEMRVECREWDVQAVEELRDLCQMM